MAREIHDSLGHYLTVVNVQPEAAGKLLDRDPEKAREAVALAKTSASESLSEVRRSVRALKPLALEKRTRPKHFAALAREFGGTGIAVSFEVMGQERDLSRRPNCYSTGPWRRIDQRPEYSGALGWRPNCLRASDVRLTVADNGRGSSGNAQGLDGTGFGIPGLEERASAPVAGLALTLTEEVSYWRSKFLRRRRESRERYRATSGTGFDRRGSGPREAGSENDPRPRRGDTGGGGGRRWRGSAEAYPGSATRGSARGRQDASHGRHRARAASQAEYPRHAHIPHDLRRRRVVFEGLRAGARGYVLKDTLGGARCGDTEGPPGRGGARGEVTSKVSRSSGGSPRPRAQGARGPNPLRA